MKLAIFCKWIDNCVVDYNKLPNFKHKCLWSCFNLTLMILSFWAMVRDIDTSIP